MKYFAYGMNTHPESMSHRCPGARALGSAVLPDHRFRFALYADVVESPGSTAEGVLWEITRENLASLDILEGWPRFYTRKWVSVEWQGSTVQALVYQMTPDNPDRAPVAGYLKTLEEGYRHFGVSLEQLACANY